MRTLLAFTLALILACDNSSGPGFTLDVTPDSVQLIRNDSALLSVSALDGDSHLVTGVAVSFASADTNIVTVTNLGLVRSHTTLGHTTVRVQSGGAITDVPVTVIPTPSGMVVIPADTTVRPTTGVQFRAVVFDETGDTIRGVAVTWGSLDTTIAVVSASGLAIAKSKPGAAFITATYRGFLAGGILRVVVPGVPTHITVTPADTAIPAGADVQLTATARDGFDDPVLGPAITWTSENTPVATVSGTGLVHSVGPVGIATIRATSGTVSGSAQVRVLDSLIVAHIPLPGGGPFGSAVSAPGVGWVGIPQLGQVKKINILAGTVTGTAFPGPWPVQISAKSDGSRIYVPSFFRNAMVTSINTATLARVDTVFATDHTEDAYGVANMASSDTVFVGITNGPIFKVEMTSHTVFGMLNLPVAAGYHFEWNKNQSLLYASQRAFDGGRVFEIDPHSFTVLRTFATGGGAQGIQLSADDGKLFVAAQNGGVIVWDVAGDSLITTYATPGCTPYGLLRTPDNSRLYVGCVYEGLVEVLDPTTGALITTVHVGGAPRELSYDASSNRLIVPNESGWVDIIR